MSTFEGDDTASGYSRRRLACGVSVATRFADADAALLVSMVCSDAGDVTSNSFGA